MTELPASTSYENGHGAALIAFDRRRKCRIRFPKASVRKRRTTAAGYCSAHCQAGRISWGNGRAGRVDCEEPRHCAGLHQRPGSVSLARPVLTHASDGVCTGTRKPLWTDGCTLVRAPRSTTCHPCSVCAVLTGDEASIDADNWVWIHDRIKELIKVRGFQVAPAELEGHILSHPDVRDACVVGYALTICVRDDVIDKVSSESRTTTAERYPWLSSFSPSLPPHA
jgi:acyl-CoA synthetase (AMP-forming)/AMP-acid ligase II